ncbi:DUF397 domain-containing protein [Streptomyces virginiae]|nr:DUF397 domain-containing protein [Streptomyces virginiae]MCX5174226.1 DUF397 domain-containing protein [Streptomyces virginiae]
MTSPTVSTRLAPECSWTKSSYSDQQGGNCVETVALADIVGVRDSKQTNGPALVVTRSAWAHFIDMVQS